MNWSLSKLFAGLNDGIQQRLETVRACYSHPGTKGNASENVWLQLLKDYLPKRYNVATAHIVDSNNAFSEQIDVVIFDQQYSPFIFNFEGQTIIPAESVYAVFEAKQTMDSKLVDYAKKKVASVRRLYRTSLPIPYAGGTYPPKRLQLNPIYGGILSFESEWNPALGEPLLKALNNVEDDGYLDLGCVAAHGYFVFNHKTRQYNIQEGVKPATLFLLNLISQLQNSATVPMIDIQAYAKWLSND